MHGTIEYFKVAVFGEWMIVGAILICLPSIGVLLRRNYFPLNRRPQITVNIRVIGAFAMAYNTLSRGFGLPCFLVSIVGWFAGLIYYFSLIMFGWTIYCHMRINIIQQQAYKAANDVNTHKTMSFAVDGFNEDINAEILYYRRRSSAKFLLKLFVGAVFCVYVPLVALSWFLPKGREDVTFFSAGAYCVFPGAFLTIAGAYVLILAIYSVWITTKYRRQAKNIRDSLKLKQELKIVVIVCTLLALVVFIGTIENAENKHVPTWWRILWSISLAGVELSTSGVRVIETFVAARKHRRALIEMQEANGGGTSETDDYDDEFDDDHMSFQTISDNSVTDNNNNNDNNDDADEEVVTLKNKNNQLNQSSNSNHHSATTSDDGSHTPAIVLGSTHGSTSVDSSGSSLSNTQQHLRKKQNASDKLRSSASKKAPNKSNSDTKSELLSEQAATTVAKSQMDGRRGSRARLAISNPVKALERDFASREFRLAFAVFLEGLLSLESLIFVERGKTFLDKARQIDAAHDEQGDSGRYQSLLPQFQSIVRDHISAAAVLPVQVSGPLIQRCSSAAKRHRCDVQAMRLVYEQVMTLMALSFVPRFVDESPHWRTSPAQLSAMHRSSLGNTAPFSVDFYFSAFDKKRRRSPRNNNGEAKPTTTTTTNTTTANHTKGVITTTTRTNKRRALRSPIHRRQQIRDDDNTPYHSRDSFHSRRKVTKRRFTRGTTSQTSAVPSHRSQGNNHNDNIDVDSFDSSFDSFLSSTLNSDEE